jgi:hypothetical protein
VVVVEECWAVVVGMRGFVVVVGLVMLGVAGCQSARSAIPIVLESSELVPPIDPRLLTTHEAAVRGISAMMIRDLGLPVPADMTVYVYGSRRHFEEGLVRDGQLSPERASELSAFAIGVARPRRLLFYDHTTERGREWLRLVAHELTHVSQIELAGRDGGPAQWMKEGMAEWVAFSVLERLRLDSVARRREVARAGVGRFVASAPTRPDLGALGSAAGFTAQHRADGAVPTYQLAFLMVDRLVERRGLPLVADYFRAFSESGDRQANFERVFGQTVGAFEREVLDDLATAPR